MLELGITGSLLASIIYDAAKGIYRKFNDPLNEALEDTNRHFSQTRGIEFKIDTLTKILAGEIATEQIEQFRAGAGVIDADKIALQLAIFGDLYFEDESQILPTARDILNYLVSRFEHHLLSQPETGLELIASYEKIHYTQISNQIHSTHSHILHEIQSLRDLIIQQKLSATKTSRVKVIVEIVYWSTTCCTH